MAVFLLMKLYVFGKFRFADIYITNANTHLMNQKSLLKFKFWNRSPFNEIHCKRHWL